MHLASCGSVLIALALAACQPAPAFNVGVHTSTLSSPPGAAASADPLRIVDSAVRLEVEADQAVITDGGGTYLGDVLVTSQTTMRRAVGPGPDAPSLYGRASLDAASRGGTHFYLKKFATTTSRSTSFPPGVVRYASATFAVYRVEPGAWPALPPKYRPAPLATSP